MPDEFSQQYSELLDETYDCVDRIVLNAYFPLIMHPGGFRTWWRAFRGTDQDLDNAHLIRFAGRFSRRVHAFAEKHKIPLVRCATRERKHKIAEKHLPSDPNQTGVFCILVGRAPAGIWDVQRYGNGGLNIRRKDPAPYVNTYFFHIMDPQWGHVIIRFCPHPPFFAQVILNGHEYVAREAQRQGLNFTKEGNCFTKISDAAGLARIADTLSAERSIGRLAEVCERWIYSSCLCFAVELAEQKRTGFQYQYSVYQAEYSRNLLFTRGRQMEQVFHGVIDRTRAPLNINTVKTIFGYKHRPFVMKRSQDQDEGPRIEAVVERPKYDLTVFKIHFKRLTVKIYTKGERVLRIEAIAHNTKDLRCGTSLGRLPRIVDGLKKMVERFLSVLRCVDAPFIDAGALEELPEPTLVGTTRIAGIDLNKPRMRAVLEGIVALSTNLAGFSVSDVALKVSQILGSTVGGYTARQAAYDLKKLRAKKLIGKLKSTRSYTATAQGLRSVVALLVLREKVIKPLLAAAGKRKSGRKPMNSTPLDKHYEALQIGMQHLLNTLRIAS